MTAKVKVAGFQASAQMAGVKHRGRLDLGLIAASRPCPAAGVFTRNRMRAPAVELDERRLKSGIAQAVIVNSGNANTCVGQAGMKSARAATAAVARALGASSGSVLMSSTGVIGEPLPLERVLAAVPALVKSLRPEGLPEFARAIMTTDTFPKLAIRKLTLARRQVVIAGVCKGAGMIMPDMATMLAYLLTDAELSGPAMKKMLRQAVDGSFNAVSVDGDTSTSDSAIMMASGESGVRVERSAASKKAFQAALDDLCLELATMIARDGEGATRLVRVTVEGARTREEADRVARRVANSLLVKTALHAGDPNWGRVMAAVGSAGVPLEMKRVSLWFEDKKRSMLVAEKAAAAGTYSEEKAARILSGREPGIRINLGRGRVSRTILTCDLSAQYVKINAEYRT